MVTQCLTPSDVPKKISVFSAWRFLCFWALVLFGGQTMTFFVWRLFGEGVDKSPLNQCETVVQFFLRECLHIQSAELNLVVSTTAVRDHVWERESDTIVHSVSPTYAHRLSPLCIGSSPVTSPGVPPLRLSSLPHVYNKWNCTVRQRRKTKWRFAFSFLFVKNSLRNEPHLDAWLTFCLSARVCLSMRECLSKYVKYI